METLDKINKAHELMEDCKSRIKCQLNHLETYDSFKGLGLFTAKEDVQNKIKSLVKVQERLLNYMRKQAINLITEIK
jgi:hypothetical protein